MIEPTEKDIGRKVVYTGNTHPGGELEEGIITSFNSTSVFVRYGDKHTSQATNPRDLQWYGCCRMFVEITPHDGSQNVETRDLAILLIAMGEAIGGEDFHVMQGSPQARTVLLSTDIFGLRAELITAPGAPGE